MVLNTVPIRAQITIGNLVVVTPYVLSFSVSKDRNKKSTFNASLKVLSTGLSSLGGSDITISAGVEGRQNRIFTGFVLNANPTPCWDDPRYVVLNIAGSDVLHRLEYEKYTRLQSSSESNWALITGVNRKAPKGSQFKLVNHEVIMPTDGDYTTDAEKYNSFQKTDLEELASPISQSDNNIVKLKFNNLEYV